MCLYLHCKTKTTIRIVNGKGRKDRMVPVPKNCFNLLRLYYKKYRPKIYLFNGQSSIQYSPMSLTKVLKINLKKSGITKKIRLHDLRHSRATHLLESSLEIEHIRALLGHKKISTTQQYLHLSVKSLKDAIFRIEN